MEPYAGLPRYPRQINIPDDSDQNAALTYNTTNEGVIDRTAWLRQRIALTQGLNWPYRGALPFVQTVPLAAPIYDTHGERWVLGGQVTANSAAAVYWSQDYGLTWTPTPTVANNDNILALGQHPTTGRIIAISRLNAYYSDDLTAAWNSVGGVFPGTTIQLRRLHFLPSVGLFVAIGTNVDKPHIATSADGTAWVLQDAQIPASMQGVQEWRTAQSATRILAFPFFGAQDGTYATSDDGITWTQRTFPLSSQVSAVAYGADEFLACVAAGPTLASPDGIKWTIRSTANRFFWDLAFFESTWIGLYSANGGGLDMVVRASHDDGVTWVHGGVALTGGNVAVDKIGAGPGQAMVTNGIVTIASQNVG